MVDPSPTHLEVLAGRVEAATELTRALSDEVLLACGWQLNHDAEDVAAWRTDAGVCEGEDGKDYPVTFDDRMNWACWYAPGERPFRGEWIDGHYRPDPLVNLDAATRLFPAGTMHRSGHDGTGPDPSLFYCEAVTDAPQCVIVRAVADTEPQARAAAALRAHASRVGDGRGE